MSDSGKTSERVKSWDNERVPDHLRAHYEMSIRQIEDFRAIFPYPLETYLDTELRYKIPRGYVFLSNRYGFLIKLGIHDSLLDKQVEIYSTGSTFAALPWDEIQSIFIAVIEEPIRVIAEKAGLYLTDYLADCTKSELIDAIAIALHARFGIFEMMNLRELAEKKGISGEEFDELWLRVSRNIEAAIALT